MSFPLQTHGIAHDSNACFCLHAFALKFSHLSLMHAYRIMLYTNLLVFSATFHITGPDTRQIAYGDGRNALALNGMVDYDVEKDC